jgi:hypothetical protein
MIYSDSKTVKDVLKFLDKEQLWRNSNFLLGESSARMGAYKATFSEYKRDRIKQNYIKRIQNEKVKVFYLDLVEHVLNELGEDVDRGPRTMIYNKSYWIERVNKFYRLQSYYDALIELDIEYHT